jgi:hypothetical protein
MGVGRKMGDWVDVDGTRREEVWWGMFVAN